MKTTSILFLIIIFAFLSLIIYVGYKTQEEKFERKKKEFQELSNQQTKLS
jgi:TM2 domain-containing membrane protein YozV